METSHQYIIKNRELHGTQRVNLCTQLLARTCRDCMDMDVCACVCLNDYLMMYFERSSVIHCLAALTKSSSVL